MARTGTRFGGLAGEMLSRTISIGSIVTGVMFASCIWLLGLVASKIDNDLVVAAAAQFIVAFFLAHFTVEGYSDEWERAGHAIPAGKVGIVAVRYIALTVLMLAPLFVIFRSREAALTLLLTPKASAVGLVAYLLALVASPPALLVAAVAADSWSDLLSSAQWGSRFRGRWVDFFLIYVVFTGSLIVLIFVAVPAIAFARTKSMEAMQTTAEVAGLFAVGFTISLLGRLCGSFAAPVIEEPTETKPVPTRSLHPTLVQYKGGTARVDDAPAAPPPAAEGPRRVPLLDAGTRIEQLRAAHGSDAAALAAALRELDETFLPNPAVRQALVTALVAAGRQQEAVELAREAIPASIKMGGVAAAAPIYEAVLASGETFDLTPEQILAIGDALKSMKHYTGAVKVYAAVLNANANDVKAMKGMIAVAQLFAQQPDTVASAARIYDHLLSRCAGSPLLDFVSTERAKLQRKAG